MVGGGLDLRPRVSGRLLALFRQVGRPVEQGGAGGGQGGARSLQGDLQHSLLLQPPPHGMWINYCGYWMNGIIFRWTHFDFEWPGLLLICF